MRLYSPLIQDRCGGCNQACRGHATSIPTEPRVAYTAATTDLTIHPKPQRSGLTDRETPKAVVIVQAATVCTVPQWVATARDRSSPRQASCGRLVNGNYACYADKFRTWTVACELVEVVKGILINTSYMPEGPDAAGEAELRTLIPVD